MEEQQCINIYCKVRFMPNNSYQWCDECFAIILAIYVARDKLKLPHIKIESVQYHANNTAHWIKDSN